MRFIDFTIEKTIRSIAFHFGITKEINIMIDIL